jgi:hypothetical protein
MSARDLHLRVVHFGFGAGSGGTSVLAMFPEQEVTLTILTNLGHAKFPFNRLMNIANSFQYSPAKILFNVWLAILLCGVGFIFYNKMKKNHYKKFKQEK